MQVQADVQVDYVATDAEASDVRPESKPKKFSLCDLQAGDYLSVHSGKKEISFLRSRGGGIIPWKDCSASEAYRIIFEDVPVMPGEAKLVFWNHYHLGTEVILVDHANKSFVLKVC
jgi:hypothetical protein